MLICMTKDFAKLLKKANIGQKKLNEAINEICGGNIIPLGHKVFKKRIGSMFGGKRGGYRSIVYIRFEQVIVFLYLYAKNERENITEREMKAFSEFADLLDQMDLQNFQKAIADNKLLRWDYGK